MYKFDHQATGVTSEAGTIYPSGAYEFTPSFSAVCVSQSLLSHVVFCRSLFVLLFLFCFFHLAIVLSVLLLFKASDYSFGIFS